MTEIILGTALFLMWVLMRIEVKVFDKEMTSHLGTYKEDSSSEPETAVNVEFDGIGRLTPYALILTFQHS